MILDKDILLCEAEAENVLEEIMSIVSKHFNQRVSVQFNYTDWNELRENEDMDNGIGPRLIAPEFSLEYDLSTRSSDMGSIISTVNQHYTCSLLQSEKKGCVRLHCENYEGSFVDALGWLLSAIESILTDLSNKKIDFDHFTLYVYTLY